MPQDKFTPPCSLFTAQHQSLPVFIIAKIALRRDPEELIDVRAPPSVVVFYVGVQLPVRAREREQSVGVEKSGDMCERLGREAKQHAWAMAEQVSLSMLSKCTGVSVR